MTQRIDNDGRLLQMLVEERRLQIAAEFDPHYFFDMYAASQLLARYDVGYDELERGITDGGDDGGIDALFCLLDGRLQYGDTTSVHLTSRPQLELVVIQAKLSPTFEEVALTKLQLALSELLDFSIPLDDLVEKYNDRVLDGIAAFRRVSEATISALPDLRVLVYFVTLGSKPHQKVVRRAHDLRSGVRDKFPRADVRVELIGASALLDLIRQNRAAKRLVLRVHPRSTITLDDYSFVALVNLCDFFEFITGPDGRVHTWLFNSNVRDYEGSVDVNHEIRSTLAHPRGEDFWWLNNGVTIIARDIDSRQTYLAIDDPQIVNGLQTSREVHEHFWQRTADGTERRSVLVRVIGLPSGAVADRIIRATNNQTTIPAEWLRATDRVQRNIEEYFLTQNLFYERRKNAFRSTNVPLEHIISPTALSEAIAAVLLQKPEVVKYPGIVMRDEAIYREAFDEAIPLEVFLTAWRITSGVKRWIRTNIFGTSRIRADIARLHVAALATASLCQATSQPPKALLADGVPEEFDDAFIESCFAVTARIMRLRMRKPSRRLGSPEYTARLLAPEATTQVLINRPQLPPGWAVRRPRRRQHLPYQRSPSAT